MSESEQKLFINKILVIISAALIINIIGGGFWTWTLSRDNSKEIIYVKEKVKMNSDNSKQNFWLSQKNEDRIIEVNNKVENHINKN